LPTRPVVALAALFADAATLAAAELAELVTLESPSDAFDATWAALSLTAPAVSDVVEALRMAARRTEKVDCRRTARDAARDMADANRGGRMGFAARESMGGVVVERWQLRQRGDDFSGRPCGRNPSANSHDSMTSTESFAFEAERSHYPDALGIFVETKSSTYRTLEESLKQHLIPEALSKTLRINHPLSRGRTLVLNKQHMNPGITTALHRNPPRKSLAM